MRMMGEPQVELIPWFSPKSNQLESKLLLTLDVRLDWVKLIKDPLTNITQTEIYMGHTEACWWAWIANQRLCERAFHILLCKPWCTRLAWFMLFCLEDTFLNYLACGLVAGPTIPLHLNAITHRGPLNGNISTIPANIWSGQQRSVSLWKVKWKSKMKKGDMRLIADSDSNSRYRMCYCPVYWQGVGDLFSPYMDVFKVEVFAL